jgi:transposase
VLPERLLEQHFDGAQNSAEGKEKKNWAGYNEGQTQEKLLFLELLEDLTSLIEEEPRKGAGRPSAGLREMVFACTCKVYECLSSRRANSDLEIARRRGYLSRTPHFNTVIKYLNKPELTPLLTALIRISALPLAGYEETAAIDASGLSSAFYSRWLDYRFGEDKRVRDWLKIHVACGVKSHIVTAITVTDGTSNDSPQFPKLLKDTAQAFKIKSVVADKGYASRGNLDAAWNLGIVPFIPFKSNAVGKKQGSLAWRRMFYYFQYHQERFMSAYHARSNVESSFSMLKRKFDNRLFSKKEVAQVNEALLKVLCHNLVVLVKEAKENGFNIDLEESAHKLPRLHMNLRI